MFKEFIGREVKCLYKDFDQDKIARGTLVEMEGSHIKITGRLGTIILHINQVVKLGEKS